MKHLWGEVKFGSLLKLKSGDGLTAKNMKEGPYPVYGGNGIAGSHNHYNRVGPQLIIGRVGALCGNVRKVDGKFWLTDNAFQLTDGIEHFDLDFLTYYLNFLDLRSYARQAAQPVISNSSLKDIVLCYPLKLEEQKQIVAILDKAFAAIGRAKANIEKNIENAKELFQSKLNEIFSQQGEGWEERKFKDVCVLQRGFDLPTRLREKGDYDLITSSGVNDTHKEYKVQGPGVVTGRSGSIGSVFYVENHFWPLNTTLYIKEFKGNRQKYIYYFLKNFDLSRYSSGAGVPTLNRNFVHDELVLTTPKIEIQDRIVKTLDKLDIKSQEVINHYMSKLQSLEELKKSLLQKAFAGELTSDEAKLEEMINEPLAMVAEGLEEYKTKD